jgi:uncharacterized membrane protein YhaH (DUF805 family)
MLGPIQSIKTCLAKSIQFSGRATRAEFWWFAVVVLPLIAIGFGIVSAAEFTKDSLLAAFFLRVAICVPLLAAAARRAIDAGFSSTWVGWGFAALFFAIGLTEIDRLAPLQTNTAWMRPVAAMMIVISLAALAYILSRQSTSNSTEVQP